MPKLIHYGSADGSLVGAHTCALFVHRAIMAPRARPWRLLWATSANAETFVHAEGECSARYFRTMRDAIAYGIRAYGETAQRFND
jgi:hypothetical protein